MDRDQLYRYIEVTFQACLVISQAKNCDYAMGKDAFMNFRQVENLRLCSVEKGILIRLSDKFTRLCNLLEKPPAVKDESFEDTIKDAINYLAILAAYRHSKRDMEPLPAQD